MHGLDHLRSNNDQSELRVKFDTHRKRVLDAAVIDCIIVDNRSFGDFRKVGMYENLFSL